MPQCPVCGAHVSRFGLQAHVNRCLDARLGNAAENAQTPPQVCMLAGEVGLQRLQLRHRLYGSPARPNQQGGGVLAVRIGAVELTGPHSSRASELFCRVEVRLGEQTSVRSLPFTPAPAGIAALSGSLEFVLCADFAEEFIFDVPEYFGSAEVGVRVFAVAAPAAVAAPVPASPSPSLAGGVAARDVPPSVFYGTLHPLQGVVRSIFSGQACSNRRAQTPATEYVSAVLDAVEL